MTAPQETENPFLDFPFRELKICETGIKSNLEFVKEHKLAEKLDDCRFFASNLASYAHKDMLGSSLPIGFMNMDYGMHEVERDLSVSLLLAFYRGHDSLFDVNTLKPAFFLLRSALEGTQTCIYYYEEYLKIQKNTQMQDGLNCKPAIETISPQMDKWLKGEEDTPRAQKLKKIFESGNFPVLEKEFSFKDHISKHKSHLDNILHSKVRLPGGRPLNQRNLFEYYLNYYFAVITDIAVMLAVFKPINVIELPIDEKFGGSAPLILDSLHPGLFEKLIPQKLFSAIVMIAEQDIETQSLKEFVLSQPDLTKEEIDKSFDWLNEFNGKPSPTLKEITTEEGKIKQ